MQKTSKKIISVMLSVMMILTVLTPSFTSFAASVGINITDNSGNDITERQEVQEYRSVQLKYVNSGEVPEGAYVEWKSNLPLLAGVDDSGKVTGYDYSKSAVIQLWLDENIRILPIVGDSMADSIMNTLTSTGVDLDDMNNDLIVSIVRGIAGDTLADSLKAALDNMNVEITATLYSADGKKLASDTIEFVVTKSIIASIAPTGVHITNKKTVPLTVAVGATVQLYGACTPVRLKQGIKWAMGSNAFDLNSKKYASVSSEGLVTFTAAGTATVRVVPESALYPEFSDTITFTVLDPADLPVESFDIVGTTTVEEGKTTQLAIDNVAPAGSYTGDLVWSSADPSIAIVDQNGNVTGLDGGSGLTEYSKSTTIFATAGGVTKSVTVKVSRSVINVSLSAVEIAGADAVPIGTDYQFNANVTPARLNSNSSVVREWGINDPLSENIIWATDDTPAANLMASIDKNGMLTPLTSGLITIHTKATYNNSTVEAQKQVTIGKAITDFSISGGTSIYEGSTSQLTISNIAPADYDQAILDTAVWSVENPSIAYVDQNGLVTALDCGGNWAWNKQSTKVTVTIGGISKTIEITVKNKVLNTFTGGYINGTDNVIKDFPIAFSAVHTPERINVSRQFWGVNKDDGSAPWNASNSMGSVGDFTGGNTQNQNAVIDQSTGMVTGLNAGKTTVYTYMADLLTSYLNLTKEINIVELEPKSISITAPTRTDYVEGSVSLDLTGMEVKLTYNRADIAKYYGDEYANSLTEEQLTVTVTDYVVAEPNEAILDATQYVLVTITRAGKKYNAVFPINIASKAVTGIELENPQRVYAEGTTELNLADLKVKANYSNADSEYVDGYVVNESEFNPNLLDVEQNITVTYTHAGRSASATFPVIVYGKPVITVDSGAYNGDWTPNDIVFTLSSTHMLEGVTYYYKTGSNAEWTGITGDVFTVNSNTNDVYYFKSVNSEGIESDASKAYTVKFDNITPDFNLSQGVTDITNKSYEININDLKIGAAGIKTITVNGIEISADSTVFTVDENGIYTVVITSNNGLYKESQINVLNIDKIAPTVDSISLAHKNTGGFARFLNSLTFGKFFNKEIEVTIEAHDDGVAGIGSVEYRFLDENGTPSGDGTWQTYNENSKPVQDDNFKGYVQVRATDKAGNVSNLVRSDGYVIDKDAPKDMIVQAQYNGSEYVDNTWVAGDVSINLSATAFSDIFSYYYRVDGGEWIKLDGNKFTATLENSHFYEFEATSNSALDSEIVSLTIKIDRQVPVIRVAFEGTFGRWTGDGASFSFSTEAASISGITYYYDNGNGWTKITTGDEINLTENVNAIYRFKAVNAAGTESYPSDSYVIMIDADEPTITLTPSVTAPTSSPYTIGIETTVGEAGLKAVYMNGVDITGQAYVVASNNGLYVFTVMGNNGKITTKTLNITNFYVPVIEITAIDLGTPARILNNEFGTYFNSQKTVTITASTDGAVGISKIKYRTLDETGRVIKDWAVYDKANKPIIPSSFRGYIEACAFDANNNMSKITRSNGITVDSAAPSTPTVTVLNNGTEYTGGWVSGEVTFSLLSTAFSGIYEYQYRMDSGEWQSITGNTISVSTEGEHTYEFKSVSNSALESQSVSKTAKIENSRPVLQVVANGTIGTESDKNVKFNFYTPNALSKITYYYTVGDEWIAISGDSLELTQNINADFKFKAVNEAGVESYVSPVYSVIIDKTLPVLEGIDTGSVDSESGFISGVTPGSSDLKEFFDVKNGTFEVTENTEMGAVGTGSTLTVKGLDGTVYETYTLIIYGDVNGDGIIDAFDTSIIALVLEGSYTLSGAYKTAGELASGKVDVESYAQIKDAAVGLSVIPQ